MTSKKRQQDLLHIILSQAAKRLIKQSPRRPGPILHTNCESPSRNGLPFSAQPEVGWKRAGPCPSLQLTFLLEGTLHHRQGKPDGRTAQTFLRKSSAGGEGEGGGVWPPGWTSSKKKAHSKTKMGAWVPQTCFLEKSNKSLDVHSLSKEATGMINPPKFVLGMGCTQDGGWAKSVEAGTRCSSLQVERCFAHESAQAGFVLLK